MKFWQNRYDVSQNIYIAAKVYILALMLYRTSKLSSISAFLNTEHLVYNSFTLGMEDHLLEIFGGHDTKEVITKSLSTDSDLTWAKRTNDGTGLSYSDESAAPDGQEILLGLSLGRWVELVFRPVLSLDLVPCWLVSLISVLDLSNRGLVYLVIQLPWSYIR